MKTGNFSPQQTLTLYFVVAIIFWLSIIRVVTIKIKYRHQIQQMRVAGFLLKPHTMN